MLMWLFYIFIGVVGLFVLTMVVGLLLPERYSFTIEQVVKSDPQTVWDALVDHQRCPVSGKECKGVTLLEDGPGGSRWQENIAQAAVMYETLESEPPHFLRIQAKDTVVPLSFTCDMRLEPHADGTLVKVHVDGLIQRGTWHVPMFRVAIHLGAAKAGMKGYLAAIAKGAHGGVGVGQPPGS